MKKDKLQKLLNNLDKNTITTKKVESNITQMSNIIAYAPKEIINSFKTYTEPRNNVKTIIDFYTLAIDSIENINKEMKAIIAIEEKTNSTHLKAIEANRKIKDIISNLENYSDINFIHKLKEKTMKKIHPIVDIISNAFFKGMEHKRNKDELVVMSKFMMENDSAIFMVKYVKIMFHKNSVKKDEKDKDLIYEHLKNLKSHFKQIHNTNLMFTCDETKAELLDRQIQQLLVVEMKDIVSRKLLVLEQKYHDKNIVEACKWYLIFKNKDIEHIFKEFDDEILKIIFNLQIQFINRIEKIQKPNRKFDSEEFVFNIFQLLNLFENPDLHLFFDNYKSKLDYQNYEGMKFYFGNFALDKVYDLSKSLKGIQKNVYLLNNLNLMTNCLKEYNGQKITQIIMDYCNSIIKMWKGECEKKKGDVTQFLNVNFEIQKDYYLPEEIRGLVFEGIKKIVDQMMEKCKYKDGNEMLELRMHELFKGK